MPTVQILWFAQLREQRGVDSESIEVAPGTTIHALYASLCPPAALPVAYARNGLRVKAEELVADGDEIVFLPPVGGG